MRGFVLVGGWPGAGKTTLATALAADLEVPYLAKDDAKEALMDVLGAPAGVAESRLLGRAAVAATLRLARGCRTAVIDSTWFPDSLVAVRRLPGPCVEVRCRVALDVARRRYRDRVRDDRHLDQARGEDELWGAEVAPLGVGPLIEVDTSGRVDVGELAARVRFALGHDVS